MKQFAPAGYFGRLGCCRFAGESHDLGLHPAAFSRNDAGYRREYLNEKDNR